MRFFKKTIYIFIAAFLLISGSLLALTGNIPGLRDAQNSASLRNQDSGIKILSSKKDFRRDEDLEIRFNYQKAGKGMINSALESLGVGDEWKDISVKARIAYAGGNGAEIIPEVVYGHGGEVSVKAGKAMQGKPGAYKAVIEVEDNSGSELKTETLEKDFTWGVLAINTNKSIYTTGKSQITNHKSQTNPKSQTNSNDQNLNAQAEKGEVAYIQMGVLNNDGHTICDASLKLQITNPKLQITILSTEDGTIERSGKCSGNNVTDAPDYSAYYTLPAAEKSQGPNPNDQENLKSQNPNDQTNVAQFQSQEGSTQSMEPTELITGTYQMKLTNLDTGYEITDFFEVRESVPFEVERIGPTRIYPLADYSAVLKIKANRDFKGEIRESVPDSFAIKFQYPNPNDQTNPNVQNPYKPNVRIESAGGRSKLKIITWQVDWKAGESYELSYQFDAPDISPEFYLLGPLEFYE